MRPQMTLSRKGMIVIALPVLIQVGFVIWYGQLVEQSNYIAVRENHQKAAIGLTNWIGLVIAVSHLSALAFAGTEDNTLLGIFETARSTLNRDMPEFASAVGDSIVQKKRVAEIQSLTNRLEDILSAPINSNRPKSAD